MFALYRGLFSGIQSLFEGWAIGLFIRFGFAAVLFMYFWNSAMTKIGRDFSNILSPTAGAYAQIWPKEMEAAGFNPSALSTFHHVVVYLGTYAEFILPVLLVIGLFGRLAALGMMGFIAVQTYVDVTAHGQSARALGAWFDRFADAAIWDQRTLWLLPLLILVIVGPGPISADRVIGLEPAKRDDDDWR